MSFLPSLFLLSPCPACWASCHFHCTGFSSHSASTTGVLTKLGFCCAWPLPCGGLAKAVSARLNLRNGTRDGGGVCNFLESVSLPQKFEEMDGPVLQLGYSSVLFDKQRKTIPWGVRAVQFSQSVMSPWITACQASLSITNSQSLHKLMSIKSVMPSSHLIFYHPLLLLPPILPNIRVFSNESTLCMRWPQYWSS